MVTKKSPTRARTARGPLTSMRVTPGFRDYVLDQLEGLPALRARSMFGGIGLYSGDVFFGIVATDVLYFKVGDTNRAGYEQAGSSAFRPYADRAMAMPYYNVPAAILEDAIALKRWAAAAVAVAKTTKMPSRRARRR